MFRHILLPTDGSDLSEKGVKQTITMAKALGAQITAVHVVRSYHPPSEEGFFMPEVAVLLHGSETANVLTHSKIPVLVLR